MIKKKLSAIYILQQVNKNLWQFKVSLREKLKVTQFINKVKSLEKWNRNIKKEWKDLKSKTHQVQITFKHLQIGILNFLRKE